MLSRRTPSLALTLLAALTIAELVAPAAHALERGDACTLKAPLAITVRRPSGVLESTLDAGTPVEIIGVSEGGSARIRAGDVKADVSTGDLESACSGTLRVCRLKSAVMMYEQNRSDSRSWRVKDGANVSVLKKGKTWAAVRVGDLRGFVKTDEITASCVAESGAPALTDGDAPVAVDEVERGEGPGVLFLPFALEGAAPAGNADALLDNLYDRGASYRPDAARLPLEDSARRQDWKTLVANGAKRARGAATAYVIVGRLSMEPPKPDKPLEERHLLQLGVVETKTGNVLKAVRIRPTLDARDNWADKALASLLPSVAAAPNSRLPVLGGEGGFEVAPVQTPDAAPGPKKADASTETRERWPTLLNGWGWLTLAGAAALGVGSGYVGSLALDENERANQLSGADPAQAERRDTALAEAITADALGVAAVGVGVAGIFVFATRAGIDE